MPGVLRMACALAAALTCRTKAAWAEGHDLPPPRAPAGQSADPGVADDGVSLAQLEVAMFAHHPALRASEAREELARRAGDSEGRAPAPELVAQQWATPLARPYDLSQANMLMLGARVKLPSFAARDAGRQARAAEHAQRSEDTRLVRSALRAELRLAYARLLRSQREQVLHAQHLKFAHQLSDMAEAAYGSGRESPRALYDARTAQSRVHVEAARAQGDATEARIRLNLLVGRAADAPVGRAQPLPPCDLERAAALVTHFTDTPAVARSVHAVRAEEHLLERSERMAKRPEWTLGLDYMAMPSDGSYARYGTMVGMSLPWLAPGAKAEVARAKGALAVARADQAVAERDAALNAYLGLSELRTAQAIHAALSEGLLPNARQSFASAERDYAAGRAAAGELLARAGEVLEAELQLVAADEATHVAAIALERSLSVDLHRDPNALDTPEDPERNGRGAHR